MTASLNVTSHVARDLLQSAALFKQAPPVVWEYISNGLQYVDPGVSPTVRVHIASQTISIEDNGRGMSLADLERFFTMHAENIDRAQGRPGRGNFGTGKSAAFAIADRLRITTVRNGRRSVAELTRRDLDTASHGGALPVRLLERERSVGDPNGTRVEIGDLKRVRIDGNDVRRYLDRHLRHWRGVLVELDGLPVEPASPPLAETRTYIAGPGDPPLVSGCTLILQVALAPLAEEDCGVAILANHVLHEITLAGAERKEFSNYILGEIDIPALSQPHDGVDAYDMSRSGRLNPLNRVVVDTFAFIGPKIEVLRTELVQADRERRRRADEARLQKQADEIAKFINEDYADFARRFKSVRTSTRGVADVGPSTASLEGGTPGFLSGGDEPAKLDLGEASGDRGGGAGERAGGEPAVKPTEADLADANGRSAPVQERTRPRSGGFDVRYERQGIDNLRCKYDRDRRALVINLDHPQLAAALGDGRVDEPEFRRLSCEVALTEYAISLAYENNLAGYNTDTLDALFDVRDRIDKMSRRVAHLFG